MRRLRRPRPHVTTCAALAVVLAACASTGMPPGGPVDKKPPVLLFVLPDTGTLNARLREVVFRFNKVINEQSVQNAVVLSPTEGPIVVDWRRQSIAIHPRRGWRANTAYTVTILPGLRDLYGNATTRPLHTEFSTGSVIPAGTVRGVIFDWVAQRVVTGARIEAMIGTDTLLRYNTTADSAGRFVLPNLPSATFFVRAFDDTKRTRILDRLAAWDTTHVELADSARYDFYLYVHDSIGPHPSVPAPVQDSMSLHVKFDKPLLPGAPLDTSNFVVRRISDSSVITVRRVTPANIYDSLAAVRKRFVADSTSRADTTPAGRAARAKADSLRALAVKDSISRAQTAAIRAARDTTPKREPPPKPSRPAPLLEFVLDLATPLTSGAGMRLEVHDVKGLSGAVRAVPNQTLFVYRRPEPKDTSAVKPSPAKRP